jgi:hypothetical protein
MRTHRRYLVLFPLFIAKVALSSFYASFSLLNLMLHGSPLFSTPYPTPYPPTPHLHVIPHLDDFVSKLIASRLCFL